MLDEPSTQHGTDRGGDRREAGPRPDGAAALLLGKISADQSQAAGDQQRPADSLEASGHNQLPDVGRESAPGRGCREEHDAGGEDLAAAVQVSQRAADEEQRRQEKRVRFHHPLNVRQRRMQGRLQRRQRHVHDRAVNERHARTEDGRGQNPGAVRCRRALARAGENRGFVARRSGDGGHSPFSAGAGNTSHATSLMHTCERTKTAQALRIQTPHVTGPASLSVIGRPATLRASLI